MGESEGGRVMTLNQFMRKIGYISEKNLVTVAFEAYDKNCTEKATDEKDFYFRSGNANAVGYICGRLGIDITKLIRQKNRMAKDEPEVLHNMSSR
jgi:hypothetical protein